MHFHAIESLNFSKIAGYTKSLKCVILVIFSNFLASSAPKIYCFMTKMPLLLGLLPIRSLVTIMALFMLQFSSINITKQNITLGDPNSVLLVYCSFRIRVSVHILRREFRLFKHHFQPVILETQKADSN